MATIKLIKKTNKVWVHEPSDDLEFIFSKHYCKTVGEKFRVVEWGGSILKEYNVTDVVVKKIGGSDETFATAELLMKRLEALNYTGFYREGDVVTADIISSDPSNLATIGSDGGLFVPIINAQTNTIINDNGFSLTGNDLTINSGWIWNINGIEYTNSFDVVVPIPFASAGKQRIDLIVANNNNSFTRVAGIEDVDTTAPTQPNDTILVSFINISDGVISDPTDPITGTQFVKKSYGQPFLFSGSGSDAIIPLDPLGKSEIRLQNPALVSIAGFDLSLITGVTGAELPYYGKPYIIRNLTGSAITIKNESAAADYPFYLSGGADLVFPNGQAIYALYDVAGFNEIFKSWSAAGSGSDIIEVANLAALPATGEVAKIYIAIDTNLQYRWSGSAYVQIGGGGGSYTTIAMNLVDSAAVTGTTAITTVGTYVIPANTFKVGDIIGLRLRIIKTGENGLVSHRHSVGWIGGGSGFEILANNGAIGNTYSEIHRQMVVKSATKTQGVYVFTNANNSVGNINYHTDTSIDWTVNRNLILRLNNASTADSSVISFWELYRIRK